MDPFVQVMITKNRVWNIRLGKVPTWIWRIDKLMQTSVETLLRCNL